MAIRCELGAFPVVLRCYKLIFNYFLRLSESGGVLMDGIHNILKAAFAEDQLLLKKRKFLVEKNVRNIRLISIIINN
jgi:hypothetical protein